MLQALHANGPRRVFIADLDPARLANGKALGGGALDPRVLDVGRAVRDATGGRGGAVSVDAVDTAVTRWQCVAATRSAGMLIPSGLHEKASLMPVAEMIRREIVVRGCFSHSPANFAEALKRRARGTIGSTG